MAAKVPRSRLRLRPEELEIGEHGFIGDYEVHVDQNRRVYVDKHAILCKIWGRQEHPDHRDVSETYIERIGPDSFRVVLSRDWVSRITQFEPDRYKYMISPDEVILLGPGTTECKTCKGQGWHEITDQETKGTET